MDFFSLIWNHFRSLFVPFAAPHSTVFLLSDIIKIIEWNFPPTLCWCFSHPEHELDSHHEISDLRKEKKSQKHTRGESLQTLFVLLLRATREENTTFTHAALNITKSSVTKENCQNCFNVETFVPFNSTIPNVSSFGKILQKSWYFLFVWNFISESLWGFFGLFYSILEFVAFCSFFLFHNTTILRQERTNFMTKFAFFVWK